MRSEPLLCGVDMIHLHTKDYRVKDSKQLFLDTCTKPNQIIQELSVPFYDDKGAVYCRKAQVQRGTRSIPYFLSINNNGLALQFNPSKARHPYNLNLDVNDIDQFLHEIEKDLKSIGITLDVNNSKLNRIDLAKQDFTDRSINNYRSAMDFMQGKRMKQRGYETGYLFFNGQSETCFYDKGEELKDSSIKGLLRVEPRFKTDTSIIKNLGINRYSDFLKTDCYSWNESYNDYLNKTIFNNYTDKLILDFDQELSKLLFLKNDGRNSINKYMSLHGIDAIIQFGGSLDFLYDLMKEAGYAEVTIKKQKKKDLNLLKLKSKGNLVNVFDLITELKQKFAA